MMMTLVLGLSWVNSALGKTYTVYSYHVDPPFFMPDKPRDLSRAWIAKFNSHYPDIQFQLKQIKRPDLNKRIMKGEPYLILWANPIWFKSKDKQVQASKPIFWDADIWISQRNKPLIYESPSNLLGKTMGGRHGYFYKGVNPLADEGKITRINQNNDYDNYLKLLAGDIDVFVMSRSSYLYWQSTEIDTTMLHHAVNAHDAYTRHLLYSSNYFAISQFVDQFIENIGRDASWKQLLTNWGVENLVNPFELELEDLEGVELN